MNEWSYLPVEEIAAPRKGALATGPFGSSIGLSTFRDIGVPVIRGANLSEKISQRLSDDGLVFVDPALAERFERSRVRFGDIIFTCWGTIGQVGIIDSRSKYDEYIISNKQMKLTINENIADPLFIYYYFSSPMGQAAILDKTIGSSVPGFNLTGLRSLLVPVPRLLEQKLIASVLGALDDKIELNRRMNVTLEAMARAIFKDWFVDFGPTRAKMEGRAPYLAPDIWSLFPDRLDEKGSPKGWTGSTIGREVEVVGGSTPSTKEAAFWDGDIAWATPKDLSSLSAPVLLSTERRITDAGLSQISSGLLPVGTVLLSSRAPIGYVAITQMPVAVNQGFIAMVCRKQLSNVFVWLWTQANMDQVHQKANGSTFQEISKGNFRPIAVTIAAPDILRAFDDAVVPLFDRIVANEKENITLAATRDLLLPKLMSGEVRVKDAERMVEDVL
ncbi:restriction endonuclease subunit S [Xanthobacter sp. AM11]|uniref:restriction endonuclease subunit S n=1 Tax=Xanthobacter sp. AM11 TaxID=3380643 RepID=UPI0039BF8647